ncbi:MAG: hypothetical protein HFF66_11990, partial [Oscillospiraceae bacterium]|nr:hypothetical protein [Oscillospiraceae bacterium]
SGVQLVDSKVRDNINSVPSATTPFFSTEGLAAGDVVVYALIDGKIHATKAEGETVKINTVNRADTTATATGEGGKTWSESDVHTHSNGLKSGVTGMVGNTTYNIYFDLYGNLAAYTEGTNGGLVLITNGWYNNTISGPEYAIQAWVDGKLQTVTVGTNGSLFVGGIGQSNNTWNQLKHEFGGGSINNSNNSARTGIHTIVANLDGNVLTPVDKAYLYSQQLRMLDMRNNVIPGRDNANTSWAVSYATQYGVGNTAYNAAGNVNGSNTDGGARTFDGDSKSYYEVRALSNTVYYTVYKGIGSDSMTEGSNVVVRSYTGYNNVPVIDSTYIEDVYAVGAKQTAAGGATYYTAQVVVIELNTNYNGSRRDSEQVFIPEFTQVTNNIGIEDVTMIRGNGEVATVQVDMTRSNTSDQYDTAGGTGRNGRRPGLYYMDHSDTNADIYVIDRMSPAEIRANNYAVGYSRESYGTLGSNYAQVELLARPETAPAGNTYDIAYFGSNATLAKWNQAVATRPVASGDYNWSSRSVVTENTYTYGGTVASLVKAAPAVVLNQGANGDAGTTVNGLNERWNDWNATVNEAEFPNRIANFNTLNRNEVLVRYDDNGDVIYAISFNETNAAQIVWWNCLPALNYALTGSIKFWGNSGVNENTNTLTIPYSAADGTKPIVDLSALGASVMSHALYKEQPLGSGHWNLLNANQEGDQRPDKDNTQSYRLEVKLNSGETLIYWLTQSAATSDAKLIVKSTNAEAPASFDLTNEAHTNVLTFIGRYKANNNGTVKWTVTTPDGTFTAETDINGNVINNNIPSTLDVGDTTSITAQVVNENGTDAGTYNDTRANALNTAKAAAKAALNEFVQGWITGNELTKAEIEANAAYKAIVEMIDAATTEARAKEVFGKYTNTGSDMNPNHSGESFDGLHSNWNTGAEAKYEEAFTVNGRLYTCAKEGLLNSLDKIVADKNAAGADEQIKPVTGLNGTGTNRPTYAEANKKLGVTSVTSSKNEDGVEIRKVHIDTATLTTFLADATNGQNTEEVNLLKQNIKGTDYLFVGVGWSGPADAVKYQLLGNDGQWINSDASTLVKASDGNFYRYVAVALKSGNDWVPRTPSITDSPFTFQFVDADGNVLGSTQKSLISVVVE